jgi:effector-binding domain-containing protein
MNTSSLSPVEVVNIPRKPALVVRVECPLAELGGTLAKVLPRVFAHAMSKGHTPAGPPFVRWLEDRSLARIEAGLPLTADAAGDGDIVASELPEGPAATLTHAGPYENLDRAREELARWAAGNGARARGPLWEVYITDPASEPDVSKWETKLFLPLAD